MKIFQRMLSTDKVKLSQDELFKVAKSLILIDIPENPLPSTLVSLSIHMIKRMN